MTVSSTRTRVLFVDDEPSIRLTLTAILQQNGFDVTAAGTVGEALHEINNQQFDALISDLNIGEPSDGFTVVSAMRRTHPECVNFILTGYPAFETALQAIRNQVDDYLVKPADVEKLVNSLRSKLKNPKEHRHFQVQTTAKFLRQYSGDIVQRTRIAMKSHPRLREMCLSDEERTAYVPELLGDVIGQLECEHPEEPRIEIQAAGARHGATRRQQGYAQHMLVNDVGLLESSIYEAIQDRLLNLELSNLIPDLRYVNRALNCYLQESLKAFNVEAP